MKTSLIITAFKEPKTVAELLGRIIDPKFNNIPDGKFEIVLACPDSETEVSAREVIKKYNFENFVYVKDPGKLKPTALSMAVEKSSGEILVFTDGDVYFGENTIPKLVKELVSDEVIGAVSGRPISLDSRKTFWGYISHLLTDAAHDKREKLSGRDNSFFPVSGYIYAARRFDFKLPANTLTDDAYISYKIANSGKIISYEPEAKAFVRFPKNLKDWLAQKARSHGGFIQIKQFGILGEIKATRTFRDEVSYFWFPISYAKNLKELFWSFLLYPLRLILWIKMIWERKIMKKDAEKTWVRIESSKE